MAVIPYSRVVDVTVTRADNFVARRGFGVALFLQSTAKAGKVDASNRTKLYASIEEVAADWATTDEAYKAAQIAFSQNPRPVAFKVGYYDTSTATDAAGMTSELNAVRDADPNWYFLTVEADLRDDATLVPAIAAWAEARTCIAIIDSNDANMKYPDDETNIAYTLKQTGYERTAIFYHETVAEYPSVALAAVIGTFVLDDDESAYTPAFKTLAGITRSNITSAALQAVTGFVPQLGQDKAQGNLASVYVDIGGQNHVQFGSVLEQNTFIDEVHFGDWLKARTEEELFNILKNNKRVSFDDRGMALLASGVEVVMNRAIAAGAIAADFDDVTGEYSPEYTMIVPRATSVPASQRNARVSPPIRVSFRYAGAVHYAQADYTITS
ncbi:hypothetical protein CSC94_12730 [Zhengella mangrovi]|uniref:DUF3383 domain-containing protein n=1 Tax=Zhengella mangrovi TaxID=1982044 RepID=A0A2G1QMV0_9HYPH|nr:DUF3383 family protein [Zhengella mangrovi]PHP66548.1 hypothetical protein CSC94_12730 [Zhengella mangrovi]